MRDYILNSRSMVSDRSGPFRSKIFFEVVSHTDSTVLMIAATNRNLAAMCASQDFRENLYYSTKHSLGS